MNNQIAPIVKKITLSKKSRVHKIYDTQPIVQGQAITTFFPANATKRDPDNYYVNNPLPGNYNHGVLAVSVDTTLQVIKTAANVDPVRIVNALKYGSLKITVDQNDSQVLRVPLVDLFAFDEVDYKVAASTGVGDSQVLLEAVTLPSRGLVRLSDPFEIAANSTFSVQVELKDASNLPTEAHWTTAGYGQLKLQVGLQVAEDWTAEKNAQ